MDQPRRYTLSEAMSERNRRMGNGLDLEQLLAAQRWFAEMDAAGLIDWPEDVPINYGSGWRDGYGI